MHEYGKTLTQLGLNNKQETLRVLFEKTNIPFQEVLDKQKELLGQFPQLDTEEATAYQAKGALPAPSITEPTNAVEISTEEASEKTTPSSRTASPEPEVSNARSVNVYLPSQTQRVIEDDDDSQFVVSLMHAQKLQDQIRRNAQPNDGPLMTKALRQKMEDEKTESIKSIQIRIRLPDQTHLEALFKSTETIGDVLSFVSSSLSQPNLPFRLFTNPPKVFFLDSTATLVRKCKFSPRTLLFFEWNHNAGVPKDKFPTSGLIKADMLKSGKSITEAPDIKKDTADAKITTSGETGEGEATKKTSWLNKGKGPLSAAQKSSLMKFVKTGKK